jgi:hypothetical protein
LCAGSAAHREASSERYEYIPAQMKVIEDVCKKIRLRLYREDRHQAAAADRKKALPERVFWRR